MASNNNKKDRLEFQIGFKVDKASLKEVQTSLEGLSKLNVASTSFFGKSTDELLKIKNQAKQLSSILTETFNARLNTVNVDQFNQRLAQSKISLQDVYNTFSLAGTQGQKAFSQLASSVLTSNLALKQTSSFIQGIGQTLMNTIKWSASSSVIKAFTGSISQAFSYVKSLDSSLNDIRIVTKDSAEQMANFAVQANKAATELGRSTLDYTKAALTFYQQGLDEQAVAARTEATLKAQNITGSGKEMADYLTAVWNGYKVANEQAELYVDKLAAVADSSASNMSQLAVAMSKVASTANMLGVPVDKLNAQIATIVATTRQAPESVGNALKTIYARINDIATGADDAEISLGNYSEKMLEVGISVLDANGKLRDTGDVIDEIGGKWSSLSRQQQIYLARTMAGQRQYNNLLALFENWSNYTNLVNISLEAQGATAEKNSIYLESLAAHTEKLGAAQQRLKSSLVDTDSYKNLIDVGTGITTFFANFIESIGGGGNAILAFGGIFTSVFGTLISREINNFIVNSQAADFNVKQLAADIELTKKFGGIEGLKPGAVEQIVAAKQQIQQYYGVMTKQQINVYQGLVKEIGALAQEKAERQQILNLMKLAQNFDESGGSGKTFTDVQGQIAKLASQLDGLNKKSFFGINEVNKLNQIRKLMIDIRSHNKELFSEIDKNFGGKLSQIANLEEATSVNGKIPEQVREKWLQARQAVLQFNQAIKGLDYSGVATKKQEENVQRLSEKLKMAKGQAKQFSSQMSQLSGITSITNLIGAVGRLTSGLLSLKNVINIIDDDSLSGWEKFLQIITNITFSLPMVITGLNSVKENFNTIKKGFASVNSFQSLSKQLIARKQNTAQQELTRLAAEKTVLMEGRKLSFKELEKRTAKQILNLENERIKQTIAGTPARKEAEDKIAQLKKRQAFYAQKAAEFEKLQTKEKKQQAILTSQELTQEQKKQLLAQLDQQSNSSIYAKITNKVKGIGSAIKDAFSLHPVMAWSAVAIAAIGGIIAYVSSLPSELEKAQQEAKRLNEQAKKQYQAYSQISGLVSSVANDFKNLAEARGVLNNLTSGTEQWANQLIVVNQQVTDLINKYPILEQYLQIGADGLLSFSQGAQQAVEAGLKRQQTTAAVSYVGAKRSENQANNKVLIEQFKQSIKEASGESYNQVSQWTQKVLQKYQQDNNIFNSQEAFKEAFGFAGQGLLTYDWEDLKNDAIKAIYDNRDKLVTLNNTINTNNQTANNLIAAMIKTSTDFNQFKGYTGISSQTGQEAYERAFANSVSLLGENDLSQRYFNVRQSYTEAEGYQTVKELDFDRVVQGFEQQFKNATNQAIELVEKEDGSGWTYQYAGQVVELTRQGIISGLAYFQNQNKIDEIIAERVHKLEETGIQGALSLAGGTQNIDYSTLTLSEIQNLKENAKALQQATGFSAEEIAAAYRAAEFLFKKSIKDFVNSLSPSVQEAFNTLTVDKDLTEAAQKQLGNILQKAFDKGLNLDLITDFVDDLDSEQLEKLSTLNFDYNTGTVDQLKEALNNAGISTIATDEALQEYINSQKAAKEATLETTKANYKTIHDIVDKLKNNDSISEQDAGKLKAAGLNLDEYFDPMLDGTYKLKVSAKDFYDYANNQSLQGFKERLDQVNDLIGKVGRGEALSGSAYSGQVSDPTGESGESYSTYDHQKLENQLAILKVLGQESRERQQIIEKVKKHQDLTKDEIDLIGKQFDELGDIKDIYKNLTNQQKNLIKGLKQVGKTIDKDVDTEKLTNLTQYFNTRNVEGFAPIFQADFQAAQDLAEELLRFDHALSDVKTNYQSWKTTLNSGSMEQIALALPDIANAYSDLLGIDPSTLGDGFLRNTKNLQLFNQVLNGTDEQAVDAYNQLQELALMQIIPTVALQDEDFKSRVTQIIQMSNQLQASDIEVGATINNEDFINGVNEILAASATTKEQAQAILESLGVEANVIPTEQVSIVGTTQIPTYRVQYKNPVAKGGQTSPDDAGGLEFQYIPTGTKTIYNTTKMRGWKIVAGKKGNTPYNKVKSSPTRSSSKPSGGDGGGSTPTPTHVGPTAKPQKPDQKEQIYDPYEKVNRSLERQSNLLGQLQDQEDNLTGKDRLKNLEKQNEVLKKQNNTLKDRQRISQRADLKGTTSWYQAQLRDRLGSKIKFDSDGQISNVTDATNAATKQYNKDAKAAYSEYQKVWKDYQDWRVKYNQLSADKQAEADKEALKSLSKKQKTNALEVYGMQLNTAEDVHNYLLKVAEDRYNDTIKKLQDQHDTTLQYLEQYQNKWKEDFDARQQYFENVRQIIENELGRLQIKVDVSIDRGQLEREWLDFEEKYIKNIKDTDYTKRAQAALKQMGSYADSEQLQEMMTAIRNGRTSLNRLNGTSKQQKAEVLDILGYSESDWAEWTAAQRSDAVNRAEKIVKQNLQTNLKSIQDALVDVREKANQIREIWLSTYDQLNDDMGKTIEQYERVGSIIDHNAKLSQMVFGDEAYASALKYQKLQQDNNKTQMEYLVKYRDEWLNIYNKNKDVDEELAAKALENYQNYASQVEAMTETMIQNLGQQWQTTAQNALKKFRNDMALSYANTEWDAINKYDDAFLDPVETKFNLAEIERLYSDAADSVSDNKDEQARINKLLQDQMKILKNKQNLTQYDIDRAKAQLEIEKARYALEDARNQKTTMRLRRDSQGNYTYQYVANEQQIEDTQAKYAQATYDLYEKDKQHYKKTLNDMNSLTQDYMDKRLELEQKLRQAQATQSKAQINRIQKQIDKYDEWYNKISQGFIEDNAVIKDDYLVQSYSLEMGLDPDSTNVINDMTKNLDYFGTSMQTFVDKVAGSGGLVDALASTFDTINQETSAYITQIGEIAKSLNEGYSGQGLGFLSNILNPNNTHVIKDNIKDAKTVAEETSTAVTNTEKIVQNVSTMLKEAENFIDVLNNQNNVIQELLKAYKEIQQANDFSGKDETTTQGTGLTSSKSAESVKTIKNKISDFAEELTAYLESLFPPKDTAKAATGGYTGEWSDGGKLAYLHQKELVLNEIDTANILAAASIVKGITSSMNLDGSLIDMMAQQGTLFNSLTTQHDILDQNVHIDATFPNVTDHLEIERAFNNLVNVASMYASRKES